MKVYFVIITLMFFSVISYGDVIIGITNGSNPELFEINLVSEVVTSIGTVNGAFASFSGLANVGGQTFATDIFVSGDPNQFGAIDGTTYNGLNDQGGSNNMFALAGDDNAGLLYTIDAEDSFKLKSISTDGSVITSIGTGGGGNNFSGMAFDNNTNTLYALAANATGDLFTFDTTTGVGTLVGSTGISAGDLILGLAFDNTSNTLLLGNSTGLFSVDTNTGAANFLFDLGGRQVEGLAAFSGGVSVPEPSTYLAMLLGLALTLGIRKREK